jgi:thioredoxin 1
MSKLNVITADQFPAATAAGAVLVDFGAPWCGPCKTLEPIVAQLGEELAGRLSVVKVDVDASQDLAAELGIMAVPTLMLFKDGRKVASRSGVQSKGQLLEFVRDAL